MTSACIPTASFVIFAVGVATALGFIFPALFNGGKKRGERL